MYKPFVSNQEKHLHSLQTLEQLYEFDDFMESVSSVLGLGSNSDLDLIWWATRTVRDETKTPLNIQCTMLNSYKVTERFRDYSNLSYVNGDFENPPTFTKQFDLLWSHSSFQYVISPLDTLANWYSVTAPGGMLILIVPQTTNIQYNTEMYDQHCYNYHNYTMVSLIHMLAVNGWDCKNGFFKKDIDSCWLHAIVYKSEIRPMDPKTSSWHDLVDKGLLPDSAVKSINKYGYLRQQDLILPWVTGSIRHFKE